MTINQARAILSFIIECKRQKMTNKTIIWEMANRFNIDDKENKPTRK